MDSYSSLIIAVQKESWKISTRRAYIISDSSIMIFGSIQAKHLPALPRREIGADRESSAASGPGQFTVK